MTAEELAKHIDQPLHVVEKALAALVDKGLVAFNPPAFDPTPTHEGG